MMNMEWITNRNPNLKDLRPIFQRGDFVIYGGEFLVWNGNLVKIERFEKPPRSEDIGGGYYDGYFESYNIKAWMPLPDPPKEY